MVVGMEERWTPRRQGDLGELSAMQWLVSAGAIVYTPLLHSPYCDLIADFDGELVRVEVKTSTRRERDRWSVAVCTRGGNQSWNGLVKRIDPSRCDYLFAHVGDGRRWYIPTSALEGGTAITLGGPKYSDYEVAQGAPLAARGDSQRGATRR
jgi:PD-(D/E)XK endonuclease